MEHEEKLDSVQLEYLYLLQSQLASQKIHFEGIIERIEQQHRQEVRNLPFLNLHKPINASDSFITDRWDKRESQSYIKREW